MVIPTSQQAYSVAQGTSPIPAYIFRDRDPTEDDITYVLYTRWVNTLTKGIWALEAFIPSNGFITAQWRAWAPIVVSTVDPTSSDYLYPIGQTWINTASQIYWGLVNVTGTTATWEDLSTGVSTGILTITGNSGGSVAGDGARNINLLGSGGVTVAGNPGTHTLTVSLSGGSTAIDSVGVDASTGPGTNPVLPTAAGLITVTGGQVAAATTANVIRTDSLAANTYTIEVQRSKTEAVGTVGSNGVSHFNSADFTVDNTGFVSLTSPGNTAFTSINIQVFTTSGTYTPTPGMKQCIVEVVGGGGGGGGATSAGFGDSIIAGGGGGGAYSKGLFTAAQIGASKPVTIGAGGAGGNTTGGTGGTTSLGALISVGGGSGGSGQTQISGAQPFYSSGGSGGVPIIPGSYSINGCPGDIGFATETDAQGLIVSGYGGSTFLAEESASLAEAAAGGLQSNGNAGISFGGGGGGALQFGGPAGTFTGGAGAPGVCIITEYI